MEGINYFISYKYKKQKNKEKITDVKIVINSIIEFQLNSQLRIITKGININRLKNVHMAFFKFQITH